MSELTDKITELCVKHRLLVGNPRWWIERIMEPSVDTPMSRTLSYVRNTPKLVETWERRLNDPGWVASMVARQAEWDAERQARAAAIAKVKAKRRQRGRRK